MYKLTFKNQKLESNVSLIMKLKERVLLENFKQTNLIYQTNVLGSDCLFVCFFLSYTTLLNAEIYI